MLSKKLHEAMNAQINAELWSAYLYLSMSMDAEAKGLKGVANWFYVQFQEEQDHARIFMNYILSRDAEVKLLPIEEVRTAWTSPLEMFQDTLAHEKEVTAMINNLAAIAAEFAKNGVSINGVNQDLKPTMTDPGYDGEIQQLRVVTHLTDEETLRNTVKAVQALDFVTGDPSILRVLD